ncbi:ACT domain-containing protein [Frisingicoccus sp.]|uniref:ACT domain-containing protein n=1 Tax=Frisingicoccus sp. TaxID=1918627 RepID=UPI003AB800A4
MKKTIITVIGKDTVGIIARVCTYLAENNVNILDISQTIVQDYFNMMMIVDANAASKEFEVLSKELKELGEQIGVKIKMQHEDIFNCMHRI